MLVLVLASAICPAFFLQCDKAALNLQRGLWFGLGFNASAAVFSQLNPG